MAHIHEKIDYTVGVFIVYKGKVLLRFHDKYHFWGEPSGHIDLTETPEEAAIREVKEEVGLDVILIDNSKRYKTGPGTTRLIPPSYVNIHPISKSHRHIHFVYFAKTGSDDVNPQEEEDRSDEWKWATLEELDEMDLKADIKFYAREALKLLVNK